MNGYAPTADAINLPTSDIQRLLPNPPQAVAGEMPNTAEARYHKPLTSLDSSRPEGCDEASGESSGGSRLFLAPYIPSISSISSLHWRVSPLHIPDFDSE